MFTYYLQNVFNMCLLFRVVVFHGEEWIDILEKSGIDIVGFVHASGDIFDIGKHPYRVVCIYFVH